jgi:uncharacterized protein with HEPN domain
MVRKVGHAIHDILEAIGRVQEITRGKTFEEFESSWQLRWLVQRALEIISEASRAIPSDLTSTTLADLLTLLFRADPGSAVRTSLRT